MAAGHRDVVEEDVRIRMTPESGEIGVEDEAAARIGPPPHDEHAHPLGQLRQRLADVFVELEALGQLAQAERGLLLTRERLPARRAEVGTDLVLMAAPAASHGREGTPARTRIGGAVSTWIRGRGYDPSRELDVESLAEALDDRRPHRLWIVGRTELAHRHRDPAQIVGVRDVVIGTLSPAALVSSNASRSRRIDPCCSTAAPRRTCAEPHSFRSPTRRSAPCMLVKHTAPGTPTGGATRGAVVLRDLRIDAEAGEPRDRARSRPSSRRRSPTRPRPRAAGSRRRT